MKFLTCYGRKRNFCYHHFNTMLPLNGEMADDREHADPGSVLINGGGLQPTS